MGAAKKKKMPFENLSTFLRRLKLYLPWCDAFKHIARSANEEAYLLAKQGVDRTNPFVDI